MAERAKAKKKTAAKKVPKGATGSRGKVAKTEKKPGVGHNSSGRVSGALVKDHHEKITAIEERLVKAKAGYDKIKGELRSAYAVVKQDNIQVDDFKLARELDKRDHGSVITGYANTGDYLRAIKSDLAVQMELFQDMVVPDAGEAKLAGAHAFGNKEDRSNNPHTQGSELFAMWDEGWLEKAKSTGLTDGEGQTIN